jgi:hypothetical protein
MKDEPESTLFILRPADPWFILVVSIVRALRPTGKVRVPLGSAAWRGVRRGGGK